MVEATRRVHIFIRKIAPMPLYIGVITLVVLFLSPQTFAAYPGFDGMPNILAADGRSDDPDRPAIFHLSREPNDIYGNGGLIRSVTIKMYNKTSPASGAVDNTIYVDRIQGSCDLKIDDAYSDIRYVGDDGSSSDSNNNCGGVLDFKIPASRWQPGPKIQEGTTEVQLYVATLTFRLGDRWSNKTMDINHFRSVGATKLGIAGNKPISVDTCKGGSCVPGNWDFSLAFGTPCSSRANTVYWYDDDVGSNGPEAGTIGMEMRNEVTGASVGSTPNFGGNGQGNMSVTLNKEQRYNWNWSGVSKGNTIRITLPFDSAYYYFSCAKSAAGSWQVEWDDNYVQRNDGGIGQSFGDVSDPGNPEAPQPGQTFNFINDARNIGAVPISNEIWTCPNIADKYDVIGEGFANLTDPPTYRGNCYHGVLDAGAIHNHWPSVPTGQADEWHYTNDRNWSLSLNTQNIGFFNNDVSIGPAIGASAAAGGLIGNGGLPGWNWGTLDVKPTSGGGQTCITATAKHATSTATYTPDAPGVINFLISTTDDGKYTATADATVGSPTETRVAIDGNHRTYAWTAPSGTATAPTLCVNVPFYYNITPNGVTVSDDGGTTQQGDNVDVASTIKEQGDEPGRRHTNTPALDKGIIEFKIPSGTAEPTYSGGVVDSTPPCNNWALSVSPVAYDCTIIKNDTSGMTVSQSLPLNATNTNTSTLAVGTKLCYASYAQHPKNTTADDVTAGNSRYRYSGIICTIIVKSPKVHFLNTDVTVGRYRSTATNACTTAVSSAPIITVGAPTIKETALNGNLYGSWVEYGAFATGNITGFGSAAVSSGFSSIKPHRLTFGNNNLATLPNNLGSFVYGQNCLPNPFGQVTDNSTNLSTIGNVIFNPTISDPTSDGNFDIRKLGERPNGASDDKTGYFSKGKSIIMGPEVDPEAPPAPVVSHNYTMNVKIDLSGNTATGCAHAGGANVYVDNNAGSVVKSICTGWQEYNFGDFNIGKIHLGWIEEGDPNNPENPINYGTIRVTIKDNGVPTETIVYNSNYQANFSPAQLFDNAAIMAVYACSYWDSGMSIFSQAGAPINHCFGANMTDSAFALITTATTPPPPPPPPPPPLVNTYDNFRGRDIVIYSKKNDPDQKCSNALNNGSGNININQDIVYNRSGFNNVNELPRLVLIADCNIKIGDNVKEVNASLIAGDAIKTCKQQAKVITICRLPLTVRGAISANRLLLWRTHGADLTQTGPGSEAPGETFDLSPSQIISGYSRGLKSAKPTTVYEIDLPPRY